MPGRGRSTRARASTCNAFGCAPPGDDGSGRASPTGCGPTTSRGSTAPAAGSPRWRGRGGRGLTSSRCGRRSRRSGRRPGRSACDAPSRARGRVWPRCRGTRSSPLPTAPCPGLQGGAHRRRRPWCSVARTAGSAPRIGRRTRRSSCCGHGRLRTDRAAPVHSWDRAVDRSRSGGAGVPPWRWTPRNSDSRSLGCGRTSVTRRCWSGPVRLRRWAAGRRSEVNSMAGSTSPGSALDGPAR